MASYNKKDIDRVCRAGDMSRARAEALLRQYDGKADRVLEEKCGAVRVYVEPERVATPENRLHAAWRRASDFIDSAGQRLAHAGKRLIAPPILPVLLLALVTAPRWILMALSALFIRLSR